MISHEYQFIFVHAGRTGGSSLERAAGVEITSDQRTKHLGNTDFPDKHKGFNYYLSVYPNEFESYFKFTIVRNPFERLVSAWLWRTRVVKDLSFDFSTFVLTRPQSWSYASKFKLDDFSLRESINRFDYIGRYEELGETYEHLRKRLRLQCDHIPKTNSTSSQDYRSYYCRELVDYVLVALHLDLSLFNYCF